MGLSDVNSGHLHPSSVTGPDGIQGSRPERLRGSRKPVERDGHLDFHSTLRRSPHKPELPDCRRKFPRKRLPRRCGRHGATVLPPTAVHRSSVGRELGCTVSGVGRMPFGDQISAGLLGRYEPLLRDQVVPEVAGPVRVWVFALAGRAVPPRSPAPALTPPPPLPAPPASPPDREPRRPGGRAQRPGLRPTGSCACRRGPAPPRWGRRVRRRR